MRERHDDEVRRHVEAGRTTTDEARAEDPAANQGGVTPDALSFTEKAGNVDLGVEEPALPESTPEQAERADSPATGMYAGETEADRREEDTVRERLERAFPATEGNWKASGAMPEPDEDA